MAKSEIQVTPRLNSWGRQVGIQGQQVLMSESGRVLQRSKPMSLTDTTVSLMYAIEDEQARIAGTRAGVRDYVRVRVEAARDRVMLTGGSEDDMVVELQAVLAERKAIESAVVS